MRCFAASRLLVALLAGLCSSAGDAADADSGARLYKPCAVCHGAAAEGNRAVHAPKLAGREDWYLARQLAHFRSGVRGAATEDVRGQQMAQEDNYGRQMQPIADALPEEQALLDVAAYINTLD
jgi:cytochrome c oxidase subunit 2